MEAFTGEIRIFAGNYAPFGWALCDGAGLSVRDYPELASLIGDKEGMVYLPDLRGRIPVGKGKKPNTTTNFVVNTIGGADIVTLTAAEMPAHTHTARASTTAATSNVGASNLAMATVESSLFLYVDTTAGTLGKPSSFAPTAIGPAGGNQAHENMMQTTFVNYIICLRGIYPVPAKRSLREQIVEEHTIEIATE